VELVESEVFAGQKDALGNTFSDRLSIAKPCDIEHRWEEPVHVADEDVGLAQLHRLLGKHSHLWRLWMGTEPVRAQFWIEMQRGCPLPQALGS
jgi:hypothetical protein